MRSKKAILNIVSNLLLQVMIIVYGFIVPKIIITSFGSEVNGLVSSITQFLAYITLLESGFGPVVMAILYKPIADKDKYKISTILYKTESFFKKIALIFIIYIALLCIVYPLLIDTSFGYVYTISLIVIISISTFAEYYFGITYKIYLQAEQKSYIISIIQIITYILSIILIVLLALIGSSIHLLKLISGIIFVLRPIFQNMYVKKRFNINYNDVDKNYIIKQKWDGLAQHIAAVIHANTDITVLTIFSTLSEVSVYSVYYLVVRGLKAIVQAFSNGIDATFGNMIAKGENENLAKKFNLYEVLYFSITTIIFSSAMILIVPFVSIYTKNVTDANYIRQIFGYLIVISEFIWAIRQPYNMLVKCSGHFKETRIGAWIEAISNIILSVVLVHKFGIIGVAIGTIIAMTIRTIEFIYHANKYILKKSILNSVNKIILIITETTIILLIGKIQLVSYSSYINWGINAVLISGFSTIVVVLFNCLFYQKELKEAIKLANNILRRRENKHEQN